MNASKRIGASTKNGELVKLHRFQDDETAAEWLHTEERDFRERELMSESKAKRLYGAKALELAILHD